MNIRTIAAAALVAGVLLTLGFSALPGRQTRPDRPAELAEYQKALKIQDLAARVRELERIKAAYPSTQYKALIESAILYARIQMATTVEEVLRLHEPVIRGADGMNRVFVFYSFSWDILRHPNAARFDKAKAARAVLDYVGRGVKLSRDPRFQKALPPGELPYLEMNRPVFFLTEAAAHIFAGDTDRAAAALESFRKSGHALDQVYHYVQGDLDAARGRDKEALESYLAAAADNYGDALAKAKGLYRKLNGSPEGFEAKLEEKQRKLPFTPEVYKPDKAWEGKTVLAELFTGSECPPCVAADLGFDGLLEAFDARYLAVLEYHLPIPRPDPMMNKASRIRAQEYGVTSTPSVFFDGESKASGGGSRPMAEEKFREFAGEVKAGLAGKPVLRLEVRASRAGDLVRVEFKSGKVPAGTDVNVVLVQGEEKHRGANGLVFHKMVVREFVTLPESAVKAGAHTIDVAAAEAAAGAVLEEYERAASFRFPEKKDRIDRSNLRVVVFVQDRTTKKVLNAAAAVVPK
jgi:thiol-disulfide isomerase/thioredoxin